MVACLLKRISWAYFRLTWCFIVTNSFWISKNSAGHCFYEVTLLKQGYILQFIHVPKRSFHVNNFVQFDLLSLRRSTIETRLGC